MPWTSSKSRWFPENLGIQSDSDEAFRWSLQDLSLASGYVIGFLRSKEPSALCRADSDSKLSQKYRPTAKLPTACG